MDLIANEKGVILPVSFNEDPAPLGIGETMSFICKPPYYYGYHLAKLMFIKLAYVKKRSVRWWMCDRCPSRNGFTIRMFLIHHGGYNREDMIQLLSEPSGRVNTVDLEHYLRCIMPNLISRPADVLFSENASRNLANLEHFTNEIGGYYSGTRGISLTTRSCGATEESTNLVRYFTNHIVPFSMIMEHYLAGGENVVTIEPWWSSFHLFVDKTPLFLSPDTYREEIKKYGVYNKPRHYSKAQPSKQHNQKAQ